MPRRHRIATVAVGVVVAICGASCAGGFERPAVTQGTAGPGRLRMMIGSSTPAELDAVHKATEQWGARTGSTVEVTAAAKLPEELAKGFAGGSPPDLFYVEPAQLGAFVEAGNLYAYGDQLSDIDFLPTLRSTFTVAGHLQCAPKDVSTLGLVINEDLWEEAGLTDADIPADWAGLERVAARLTRGQVKGLVLNPELQRVGAFLRQGGGWILSADGRTATATAPGNVVGLGELATLLRSGSAAFSTQVDAGWGGEALIKRRAAMVIEGNWIRGALAEDAPDLRVKVVELPAGPAGRGNLAFTTCWGVAARSAQREAAVDLVRFLADDMQQLAAAQAFGVMPSTVSAMREYSASTPNDHAYVAGLENAQGMPTTPGLAPVLDEFSSQLPTLATVGPTPLLSTLQRDTAAVLAE